MAKAPEVYSLSLDEGRLKILSAYYAGFLAEPVPNAVFRAVKDGVTITAYNPKKGVSKVVFQGMGAYFEAKRWDKSLTQSPEPPPPLSVSKGAPIYPSRFPQIGSDEVGTGDFFGPVVVCAALVTAKDEAYLKNKGVTDSKKMNDMRIRELGPILIHRFPYSNLTLDNAHYNEVRGENNMNRIKARLHNRAISNLLAKFPGATVYQDQFAAPDLYFSYLKDEDSVCRSIHFQTKGESFYPSVALASVIARYAFLRKMDALGEEYGARFPLGSGPIVDEFAREFAAKHGLNAFKDVAKLNFKNYAKLAAESM